jgi:hypothetical protein
LRLKKEAWTWKREDAEEDRLKNLDVWKKADEPAFQVSQATKSFPKEEIYGLTSQLRRSAFNSYEHSRRIFPKK